ncbi:MAG: DUF2007 domain-containing protein [Gemmatimonas sp.]
MSEHSPDQAEWIELTTYSTGLEADMARQTLDAEGIPVLVKSRAPGIFGMNYQGAITGGVTLFVPGPEADRAFELLDLDA